MKAYLFVDFGSTNTKLTLIDIEKEEIIRTAKSYTTVETDVMLGFDRAYKELMDGLDGQVEFEKKLACSSAAGGLKMIAIGLVPELTSEAAKRAVLGAGAKIIHTYSNNLNKRELEEIKNSNCDMILLAGGTDGGNSECIIHNAKMIRDFEIKVPVVVAGNKSAVDEIEDIFSGTIDYHIAENVMPVLNKINVESSRETIRRIFMENITKAKGMTHVKNEISGIVMPTPAAVLKAAESLANGTRKEEGIGDLVVIDIGGATTDIHSLSHGYPSKQSVLLRGLEEPFAKRTVEGDLGMRYSIPTVATALNLREVENYLGKDYQYDIDKEVEMRNQNPDFISVDKKDLNFDIAMGKICARVAMKRHAGEISEIYSPLGPMSQQVGKDLMDLPTVIGTGGILIYTNASKEIMEASCYNISEPESLRPVKPSFYLDKEYILSAMGLLASVDEDMAIRMMKKYIVKVGNASEG